jgi:hypothetical protein
MDACRIRELLNYDQSSGLFHWAIKPSKHIHAGAKAGYVGASGYVRIHIHGKDYLAHRLAFLIITGSFPSEQVDHKNGIRSDNKWANLRAASRQENARNLKIQERNKSGHIGIHWKESKNRWVAQIGIEGKKIHIGNFKSLDEAVFARKEFEIKLGFYVNHGRSNAASEGRTA